MALTKEQLESNGFVFESEENGVFQQYVKPINEFGKKLVFAVTPITEVFVWIPETECGSEEEDGVRIILDVETIEQAICAAEVIAGVETD